MFNVLISDNKAAWESGQQMQMGIDRFREDSGDEAQGIKLEEPDTLKLLERVPALLMYEVLVKDPPGEVVRVGHLQHIRVYGKLISFRFAETGRIKRSRVKEEKHRFQLSDWEFSRTHWAIKDGHLPQDILAEMVETPKRYDIVLSFAGEDRVYVDHVASLLEAANVSAFYDKNETASLWGKDLVEHFDAIYRTRGRYCIMFISRHYVEKMWTSHERKSAMERAMKERTEYILPVRFDDTEVPGLHSTVGFVDARKVFPEDLTDLVLKKLGRVLS